MGGLRVWADLLPRKTELDVNVDIDALREAASALEAFRAMADMLGADPAAGMRRLKRGAPQLELEHYDAR